MHRVEGKILLRTIGGKLVPLLIIIGALGVAGASLGWFVGGSRTPVVGSLIPVLVGLLSGLVFSAIPKAGDAIPLATELAKCGKVTKREAEELVKGERDRGTYWLAS